MDFTQNQTGQCIFNSLRFAFPISNHTPFIYYMEILEQIDPDGIKFRIIMFELVGALTALLPVLMGLLQRA